MATTCNKRMQTAAALLIVVLAVIAPNLQPSAATSRVIVLEAAEAGAAAASKGAAAAAAAAKAYLEEVASAAADQPPTGGSSSSSSSSQPRECRPLLLGMMVPCGGFLLGSPGAYAPDAACCDGLDAMFQYDTVTCMCHVVNGDINQLLPAPVPVQRARVARLFAACGHNVPVDRFAAACRITEMPPIDAPPVPLPSPPAPPAPSPPAPLPPSLPEAPSQL